LIISEDDGPGLVADYAIRFFFFSMAKLAAVALSLAF